MTFEQKVRKEIRTEQLFSKGMKVRAPTQNDLCNAVARHILQNWMLPTTLDEQGTRVEGTCMEDVNSEFLEHNTLLQPHTSIRILKTVTRKEVSEYEKRNNIAFDDVDEKPRAIDTLYQKFPSLKNALARAIQELETLEKTE